MYWNSQFKASYPTYAEPKPLSIKTENNQIYCHSKEKYYFNEQQYSDNSQYFSGASQTQPNQIIINQLTQ